MRSPSTTFYLDYEVNEEYENGDYDVKNNIEYDVTDDDDIVLLLRSWITPGTLPVFMVS